MAKDGGRRGEYGSGGVKEREKRVIRVRIETFTFDFVMSGTIDSGVAKVTGLGVLDDAEGPHDLGHVEVTIWGATLAQLRSQARNWPERFDAIRGDYFGVSSREEHRFDVFVAAPRFVTAIDMLRAAHGGTIVLHVDVATEEAVDFVTQVEISGGGG